MPSRDRDGRVAYRLADRSAAALRSLAKWHLRRAATTSLFERELASALAQLTDGDDPHADKLIDRHRALRTDFAPGVPVVRVADEAGPWDPHLSRTPAAADEWRFYALDSERSWDWARFVPTLGLAFYGYGDSPQAALAEARAARRSDYVAFVAGEGEDGEGEHGVLPAVRSVDVHLADFDQLPRDDADAAR